MNKRFAFASFAALTAGTFIVMACSSSESSEFVPPNGPDAQDGPISPLVPGEGGPDSGEGGPPGSCTAEIPASFTPAWVAPTRVESACDDTELKGYWEACLANPGTTEADGTCTAYKAAHKKCTDCAEPVDKSGPIQWQLGREFYTLNVAGCIYTRQSADLDAGEKGCGEAYNAAVQCTRESCLSCITAAKSFPLFTQCQKDVGMKGICKSYEDAKVTPCAGYRNAGSPALACFPNGAEAQEPYFTRVVKTLCGPP